MDGDLITMETKPRARSWRERPLIVLDAVRFTRNLTLDMLRSAGARRVQSASHPRAAAFLMRETRDPILVTTWREDFAAGPGLIRSIRRSQGRERSAPSLLLSDRRCLSDIEEARDAGVNAVALRPLPTRTLIDRLGEIAARPRPFVRSARFNGPDRRAPRPDAGRPDYKRDADVEAGLTTPLDAARAQARAVIFEKLRRNDPLAARVGKSLERYLSCVEALDARSAEIIELHRATLGQLDDHRHAETGVRLDIVAGLERLVARRSAA